MVESVVPRNDLRFRMPFRVQQRKTMKSDGKFDRMDFLVNIFR
jgi:hypothetical protein